MEPIIEVNLDREVWYHPLVMELGTFGKPLYLAKDEQDAKRFLDRYADGLKASGYTVVRHNSLEIEARAHHEWVRIGVRTVESAV